MKVQIVDDEALTNLNPRSIRLYLRTQGWLRRTDGTSSPDVWFLPTDEGAYEVIAPSSRQTNDFPRRVSELLRTLSIAEGRSELDIIRDLSTLAFDVQYFHTHHGGPTGTAPLREAADIFSAALGLVSAATATLEEPRLVLPSRRSPATADFLRKVLAGPTIEGSYVISVWVPIPPRLTQEEDLVLFDSAGEPFERSATRHFNRALVATRAAAQEALDTDKGVDAFTERAADGISANLCEALTSLAGDNNQGFDVRFAWALDRPVANLPSLVPFTEDVVPVLEEAARVMRARVPEEEVRLRGNIVRLHRDLQLGPGDVTIAGTVVGDPTEKMRRVAVNLAEEDYQRAIEAHQAFADVELFGALQQRGTRTYLVTHTGLGVIPQV